MRGGTTPRVPAGTGAPGAARYRPRMPTAAIPLSVLDLSPVSAGSTASEALHRSVDLAVRAEAMGHARYWVAEHHSIASVVSVAPAVLIATIAARTSRMRVGSGGIMLPNHAALQVAETFRALAALHPDRIDLGIGRAPGTDQLTAVALRGSRAALSAEDFPQQFADLRRFSGVEEFPRNHPFGRIVAEPRDAPLPPTWLLGSSDYGAMAAAQFGTGFAFAGQINPGGAREAMLAYREQFRPAAGLAGEDFPAPHAILAISAIAAETDEEGLELARSHALAMMRLRQGAPEPSPAPEHTRAPHVSAAEEHAIDAAVAKQIAGSAETVAARLRERVETTRADELMIVSPVWDHELRVRSHELIARELGVTAGEPVAAGAAAS